MAGSRAGSRRSSTLAAFLGVVAAVLACEEDGAPSFDCTPYTPLGTYTSVPAPHRNAPLKVYVNDLVLHTLAEGAPPPHALVFIHDIFGWTGAPNRHVFHSVDRLAAAGGYVVVMADHFQGVPWQAAKNHGTKMQTWWKAFADEDAAHKDVIDGLVPYLRERYHSPSIGAIGTCWGGLIAMLLASEPTAIAATVSVHGARLTPAMAQAARVPVALFPTKTDPSIAPLQAILETRPFGPRCAYHKYTQVSHGFFSARGNLSDALSLANIRDVVARSTSFFASTLPS